MLSRSSFLIL